MPTKQSIRKSLEELSYQSTSSDTGLEMMVRDMLRLRERILIQRGTENPISLDKLVADSKASADFMEENLDSDSVIEVFKIICNFLQPAAIQDVALRDKYFADLAKHMHQGGLLGSLEGEIVKSLTNKNLRFSAGRNAKEKMILIEPNDLGFNIRQVYKYRGDIEEMDLSDIPTKADEDKMQIPLTPKYSFKENYEWMIDANCQYQVQLGRKGELQVKLSSLDIKSPSPDLSKFLNASQIVPSDDRKGPKRSFKERFLSMIKKEPTDSDQEKLKSGSLRSPKG